MGGPEAKEVGRGTQAAATYPEGVRRGSFRAAPRVGPPHLPPVPPMSADTLSDPTDGTLGGYLFVHERPPAFEGADGHPFTVSMEAEKVASLTAPWQGYLVFLRWAETGVGIVGHLETPTLCAGRDRDEAIAALRALPLDRVKALLDEAIARRSADGD